ncbi:oxidoreductase, partial [Streptomyces sp. NPDC051098]
AAEDVLRHLAGAPWPGPGLPVRVEDPLLWAVPNVVHPQGPQAVRFVLRPRAPLAPPRVLVSQDGRVLHRQQFLRPARPGRPLHVRVGRLEGLDPGGGPVLISL